MIFKEVGEGKPYPDHGLVTPRDWADVPPRQVRLDELVTTKRTLDLTALLSEDSTFFGDIFAHVVQWRGVMYLEDGLHRAVRAALQQRALLHARVLVIPTEVERRSTATAFRKPGTAAPGESATPNATTSPPAPETPADPPSATKDG